MNNKKYLWIVLIILLSMISISAVSAASDSASDSISTADNNGLILEENIKEDVLTSINNYNDDKDNDDELILEESDEPVLASSNEKATLKDGESSTGSFTNLDEDINGNTDEEITLSRNYKYGAGDNFINGIKINRTLTINGNGATIDGSNIARIFNVTGTNVVIKNITFINGNATGNNYDEYGGAIIFQNVAGGSIINSTFINNSATEGGAISWVDSNGSVENSIFINNSATEGGAIYGARNEMSIHNNIFLNNGDTIKLNRSIWYDAGYNWFGNNERNYDEQPSEYCDNWLFLNATADPTTISSLSTYDVKFKLYLYRNDTENIEHYDNDNLPHVNFTLTTTNGNVNDSASFGDTVTVDSISSGIANVTAKMETVEYTIYLKSPDGTNFWDLDQIINNNSDSEISLNNNYTYDQYLDKGFKSGIEISRTVTINGNNNTINGLNTACTFYVKNDNVILNNITFINGFGESPYGGAIYWTGRNGTLMHSTLKNNNATYGGAIEWDGEQGKVLYCTLEDNYAKYGGGAIYWNSIDGIVANCTFKNNTLYERVIYDGDTPIIMENGIGGGAIHWAREYGIVANCTFENNNASEGGAIKWFGEEGTLANSTLQYNSGRLGGAIHWTGGNGLIINNTIKSNTGIDLSSGNDYESQGRGIRLYLTSTTITGNIIYDEIYWFGETNGKINNNIILGNHGAYVLFVNSNEANMDNNWWSGKNADEYSTIPYNNYYLNESGDPIYFSPYAHMETWLFLNGTANPDNIPVSGTSDIIFKLDAYNKTSKNVTEYDNSLLPTVNFSLSSIKGTVDDNYTLGNTSKYTATSSGTGKVIATSEYGGYIVELNIEGIANITVNDQEFNYTAEPTIQLSYNNTATGNVTIILKGKNGHDYTFSDIPLNTTILLPEAILPDEYNLTVEYSGDEVFPGETANASLIVNKLKADIEITPYTITVKDTNGLMFEISLPENVTGELTINMSGTVSTINVTEKGVKKDGKLIINLTNDGYPVGIYNLTATCPDDEIYDLSKDKGYSVITKYTPEIKCDVEDIIYGENATVIVTINATGDLKITIDGENYYGPIVNGIGNITIPNLNVGEKTATVYYLGDENNTPNETSISFTVEKASTALNATDLTTIYNKEDYLLITLTYNEGKPISGATVSVELNGKVTNYTTDNGEIKVPTKELNAGTYDVSISFAGDSNYNASSASAKITVEAANSTVSAEDINVSYGETINIPVSSENASKVSYEIIDANGTKVKAGSIEANGNISDLDLAAGEYTVNLTTEVDKNHNPSSSTSQITINKASTTISAKDITVTYGETITIPVQSENASKVSYEIIDANGTKVKAGSIEANGNISDLDLAAGEYTVDLTTEVDKNHNPSSSTSQITINKASSTISAKDINVSYGEPAVIEVESENASEMTYQIKDKDNNIVSNGTIKANESIDLSNLAAGEYTAEISYPGNENYTSSNATAKVSINNLNTEVTANDLNTTYKEEDYLVATLKDSEGNPISGVELSVDLDGNKSFVTDSNGQIKIPTKDLAASTYTATISYEGNGTYIGSSASANVIVNRINTRFNFTNMTTTGIEQNVDGRVGEYFYFQLLDEYGNPLAGKKVSMGFNGVVYNRTTNETGWARLQINLRCVNLYTFAVEFDGDDEYAGAFDVALINVTAQTPKLSTSNKSYKSTAKTKTLTATLKSAKGNPVSGKQITFTVNGKKYTAKTNSKGIATVKVSLSKKGTYSFTATFAGDNTYKKVSKTGKLTIK